MSLLFTKTSLIVAHSNNVIGSNNNLPWNYPEDLKYFKEKTTNNVVIMGYKTYRSIGKALPNRDNIVISSKKRSINDAILQPNIQAALYLCERTYSNKEIFFIGGESIYNQVINFVDKLYITEIKQKYSGNKKFPQYPKEDFIELSRDDKDDLSFLIYERKKDVEKQL